MCISGRVCSFATVIFMSCSNQLNAVRYTFIYSYEKYDIIACVSLFVDKFVIHSRKRLFNQLIYSFWLSHCEVTLPSPHNSCKKYRGVDGTRANFPVDSFPHPTHLFEPMRRNHQCLQCLFSCAATMCIQLHSSRRLLTKVHPRNAQFYECAHGYSVESNMSVSIIICQKRKM